MSSALRWTIVCLAAVVALATVSPGRAAINGGEKYAIIIGVQRYSEAKGFAPLRYAERDAQAFYDLLVDPQRGGYDEGRVKLFTTAAGDHEGLPVRGNILAALNQLEEWARLAPDNALDTVLVYFSGHGLANGGESYLIPSDASRNDLASTGIGLEDLRSRLERSGAKKQIIILDACRFDTTPGKGTGDRQSIEFARKLEALAEAEGRAVLVSCSENEASYEDDSSGHSAFTTFLLEGLLGNADGNHDGTITVTESHEYSAAGLLSWARTRALKQTPRLYGEITLTMPLVRCPLWAELRIASVPDGAEVWIDGESTNQRTPYTSRIRLDQGRPRVLNVRLRKPGYEDLEKEVALAPGAVSDVGLALTEQPRLAAHITPSLRPLDPDLSATTFYGRTGHINGLAAAPDGTLLVATGPWHAVPQGIYVASRGDQCDPADAYTAGDPLKWPEGVAVHPDGRVFVTEGHTSTVWVIPSPGASPEVLSRAIADPRDVLVVPAGFEGPGLHPGDLLVCASAEDPAKAGVWVLDGTTRSPRRLVGPPEMGSGVAHACLGPDGMLYVMEDDATRDGITIVAISPRGELIPVLANHVVASHARQAGPLAVHPVTGDVYFAYGSSVYRVPRGTSKVEAVAAGGAGITALAFFRDGTTLIVGDGAAGQVVEIRRSPRNAPRIEVDISRGYIHGGGRDRGDPSYRQSVHVTARDDDGSADIASVTIIDPDGGVHRLTPETGPWLRPGAPATRGDWYCYAGEGAARWSQKSPDAIECFWAECGLPHPPNKGHYTITATDRQGNATTLTTQAVPPPEDIYLEVISPAHSSVIETTVPTFAWRCDRPGCAYDVEVWDADAGDEGEYSDRGWTWQAPPGAGPQVTYNADGTAELPALLPGLYFYAVRATRPAELPVEDTRVRVSTCAQVGDQFAVYEEWPEQPPELPGKLAYEASWRGRFHSTTMVYSPDPRARAWVGGNDWSPDGTELLSWGDTDTFDARWAPDGKRVAYTCEGPWSPFTSRNLDIWVADADGSHAYPVADSIQYGERFPAWSPDGLWIAYHRYTGPDDPTGAGLAGDRVRVGQGAWIVRYDGTDDHPLTATGLRGYPGYQVICLKPGAWSPDGSAIVVAFGAQPATSKIGESAASAEAAIWGIGTIAPAGGEVAPVFVAPPGAVCCTGPTDPIWSPDGEQIVFSSAHHLPALRGPGEFEPGVELWLIDANGSGQPVRLTYDNLRTRRASWWAPNTEPGKNVRVTKGGASVTFENVTEPGSTSLVVYVDPPASLPEGYQFAGRRYELSTTAEVNGTITLEIHCDESAVPADEQDRLCLLHWEDDRWVDMTVRPVDSQNRIIRGECSSLGTFFIGSPARALAVNALDSARWVALGAWAGSEAQVVHLAGNGTEPWRGALSSRPLPAP